MSTEESGGSPWQNIPACLSTGEREAKLKDPITNHKHQRVAFADRCLPFRIEASCSDAEVEVEPAVLHCDPLLFSMSLMGILITFSKNPSRLELSFHFQYHQCTSVPWQDSLPGFMHESCARAYTLTSVCVNQKWKSIVRVNGSWEKDSWKPSRAKSL